MGASRAGPVLRGPRRLPIPLREPELRDFVAPVGATTPAGAGFAPSDPLGTLACAPLPTPTCFIVPAPAQRGALDVVRGGLVRPLLIRGRGAALGGSGRGTPVHAPVRLSIVFARGILSARSKET
eukprot:1192986-Prorocentrum_minimum.AAC.1